MVIFVHVLKVSDEAFSRKSFKVSELRGGFQSGKS